MMTTLFSIIIGGLLGNLLAQGIRQKKKSIWVLALITMLAFIGYIIAAQLEYKK